VVDDKSKFDISFVNPPCYVVEVVSKDSVQEPRNFELEADLNLVISCGYKIPFISTTPCQHYPNSASAINEAEFVGESILELLRDNRVEEIFSPPDINFSFQFSILFLSLCLQFFLYYLH